MIKVINIMTGVTVASYPQNLSEVGKNMAKILNAQVPRDGTDPNPLFDKLYVAIDTSVEDLSVV